MLISVVGTREASPQTLASAEAVGGEIARRGHTVVCGGLTGVMEAACRGARTEGGHTIGVLPGTDPSHANPYVEFAIPTGLGVARNVIVALAGSAMIAIAGSYGTLSEIAFALQFGKPVIGLGTWPLRDLTGAEPVVRVDIAQEAVELAERLGGVGPSPPPTT